MKKLLVGIGVMMILMITSHFIITNKTIKTAEKDISFKERYNQMMVKSAVNEVNKKEEIK